MKILLTGASGFLGGAAERRLSREHLVAGLCHRNTGPGHVACDIRDAKALRATLASSAPDVVVHTAAYREPDVCEADPDECRRLNVAPVEALCEWLPEDVYLLFVSTDYVFDGRHPPYREADVRAPVNVYGQSKVAAEDVVAARSNGLSLRIPVLVGAGDSLDQSGYIGQLVGAIRNKHPQRLDHTHTRFPTWIDDVAEAMAFLIERRVQGVIHFSGHDGGTRYESALEVARLLNDDAGHLEPASEPLVRPAARPHNSQLLTERMESLGYTRFTPFSEVVRAVLAAVGDGG